jgi:hypothetical protein
LEIRRVSCGDGRAGRAGTQKESEKAFRGFQLWGIFNAMLQRWNLPSRQWGANGIL